MKLTSEEREVVVTFNDADKAWHVYSDSATMQGRILKLAQQIGAEVRKVGSGIEFDCPTKALRLSAKRHGGRGAIGNLRRGAKSPDSIGPVEPRTHS